LRDLPKKRLIYPGKTASKKKKKKTKVVSQLEYIPGDEKPGEELGNKEQEEKEENEAQEDMEGEKVIRKSTRTSVVVRQAERDALRAAIQATTKVSQNSSPLAIYIHGYTLISFLSLAMLNSFLCLFSQYKGKK
jgi:vacuolar protein sorting-associated protein 72